MRNFGIAALSILLVAQAPARGEPKLERVVMVNRHGVRAPTASATVLEARTGRPWPPFPAEPGALTPHGAEALSRMGAYLRSMYAKAELLPETGCPAVNAVQV
jgi:4-phytase / acid phosphatase